jgi:hypothetical protein
VFAVKAGSARFTGPGLASEKRPARGYTIRVFGSLAT